MNLSKLTYYAIQDVAPK